MKGSLRSKIVGDQIENLTERNELLCLNFWKIEIMLPQFRRRIR
jgi:hypothetical protein